MTNSIAWRGLTTTAFASLLARLGQNDEEAGPAYEHLRRALVSLFCLGEARRLWRNARTRRWTGEAPREANVEGGGSRSFYPKGE